MSDDELKRIVELVVKELKKNNPAFVTKDTCDERYGLLIKLIFGLYGFIGVVLVAVIAVLITINMQS